MATSGKIIDLRKLVAERFPQPIVSRSSSITTGIASLDQLGGLPAGAITEIASPRPSAGSALLIHSLLHRAYAERSFLALIDGRDSFDPEALPQNLLRHLLWVRCRAGIEAIKAADLLLRDGNFRIVILDVVLNASAELRRIPQTTWYRLQRLIETSASALLVLTRRPLISSAHWKLVLDNQWTLADLQSDYTPQRVMLRVERVHGSRRQLTQTA